MDFDEKIYALIDQYLNNELEGEELQAFEIRKNKDAAFAQEVELSASMKEFLSDSPENDLRKNLQELNEQFVHVPEKSKEKSGFLIWLDGLKKNLSSLINELTTAPASSPLKLALYLIPILFLTGWWWFSAKPTGPIIVENPGVDTLKTNPIPSPELEAIPPVEQPIVEEEKKSEPIKEQKELKQKKPDIQKTPDQRQLYAANYTPNPNLEFLIENNLRSNDISFEVKNKMPSNTIQTLEDAVPFRISGTFSSKENLLEKEFNVHLFSNDKNQYEEFQPMNSTKVSLQKSSDETFQFEMEKYIVLKPGVYYYILEDADERVYFVEKFKVKI